MFIYLFLLFYFFKNAKNVLFFILRYICVEDSFRYTCNTLTVERLHS